MRIAVVSDIHGNRSAFEAVLADLRETAPDLVLHGGDLAHAGAYSADVVDRVRDLAWPGVAGNADEMLWRPEALQLPRPLFDTIEEIASAERESLGAERLKWLSGLPRVQLLDGFALVHAGPESLWRAPAPDASDAELESVYGPLGRPIAVYAHIHKPYVRLLAGFIVVNTGSVSLPLDGDRRASYLLLDDRTPRIRRVSYDVDREIKALSRSRLPHADWIAKMLTTAAPLSP
jgi:putative phosphoesterase